MLEISFVQSALDPPSPTIFGKFLLENYKSWYSVSHYWSSLNGKQGSNYLELEIQPPYGGLLCSSFGGPQPLAATEEPLRPIGDFAERTYWRKNEQMDERTDGQTDWQGTILSIKLVVWTCQSKLGGAPTFGGISKLLFQNSITYFLVNQSLIWKLPDGHNSLCYHVLKENYPNKFWSRSKTSDFRTTIDGGAKNPGGGGV